MAIDPTTEEVRRRADIVEVVGQYVALREAGSGRWKACCPFHEEKTPSFYVSRDKGFYNCFGCKASGDVFKFVQQVENITFPEAKRNLAERYGVALPRGSGKELTSEQQATYAERDRLLRILAASAHWYREQFAANIGDAARDYARHRGLSQSTLEKFGVGYAPDAWDAARDFLVKKYGFKVEDCALSGLLIEKENDEGGLRYYDRYRHRLMFPIWDERGQVIGFGGRALDGGRTGTPEAKYINSPEGPLFKKSRTLYAWHLARAEAGRREAIIVTEGYMDTIALHEAGFANTVATLGTSLTTQHAQMLKRLAPKTVFLCFDGDSAGMKAALRAGPLFDANGLNVRVVALPKEDDPDTFIRKHGAIGFERALSEARMLAQYRVEMALGPGPFETVGERAEAVQAAAEVIATVSSETEKEEYVAWLAGRWARDEKIIDAARMQMIEAAVRRQVEAAAKRARGETSSDRAAGQVHSFERGNGSSWERNSNGGWQKREGWDNRFRDGQQSTLGADSEEMVRETLSGAAVGKMSGAARAERMLVGVMLNAPSWRARILESMPGTRWTSETHYEIAAILREYPANEPVEPTELLEKLSPEAAGLAGELMLSDEAQSPAAPAVIEDLIARIESYWARQHEREIIDLIKGKLERAEDISPEEFQAYNQALIATKRKAPPAEVA